MIVVSKWGAAAQSWATAPATLTEKRAMKKEEEDAASTANACTCQKQQIFEITRHISRFYLQYKFHVRDLYEHIFNKQFCPLEWE